MPKGRLYRAEFSGALTPSGRLYRAEFGGTVSTAPKGRVYRAEFAGVAAVVILPIAGSTVEPETIVPLTAVLQGGGTADSYLWRRVSGPVATLTSVGGSALLRAPSAMPPGAVVVVGVTAKIGTVTSPEVFVTITVLPQLDWSRVPGGAWVSAKR